MFGKRRGQAAHTASQRRPRNNISNANYNVLAELKEEDDVEDTNEDSGLGRTSPDASLGRTADTDGFKVVPKKANKQDKSDKQNEVSKLQHRLYNVIRRPEPSETLPAIMKKDQWRMGGETVATVTRPLKTAISRLAKSRATTKTRMNGEMPKEIFVDTFARGLMLMFRVTSEYRPDGPASRNSPNVFQSPSGMWFITKLRRSVILRVHAWHVEVLLFYTYDKKGLAGKPEDIQDEHIGVVPHGMSMEEWEKKWRQNKHTPLVVEKMAGGEEDEILPMTTCYFTQIHSFTFNEMGRIIGNVTGASLDAVDAL